MPRLLQLFFLLMVFNLAAEYCEYVLGIYLTKPLLLTVLSLWFYLTVKSDWVSSQKWILAGLIFSIGGDTLLMFVENGGASSLFFTLGLGSFLVTHICYAVGFLKYEDPQKGRVARQLWLAIPLVIYFIINLWILYPALPADLKIPVIVYSSMITIMALTAVNLQGLFPEKHFPLLLMGVLLFVFSDTIIGLNKFITSIPYARLLIMIPYLLGQYLIATSFSKVGSSMAKYK